MSILEPVGALALAGLLLLNVLPAPAAAQAANAGAMKDYVEAVEYGDGLTGAGEHSSAVRAYERARRIAREQELPVDGSVLEAKIAAAALARDARPPPSTELVPAPLPPVPHAPGETASVTFLAGHPGKILPWSLQRERFVVMDMRATAAELKALEANLRKVVEVVMRAPLLDPPAGFDVRTRATLGDIESIEERKAHLARGLPLLGDVSFGFPSYFVLGKPPRAGDAEPGPVFKEDELHCTLRLGFNSPPVPGTAYEDGEGTFLQEPKKDGEIGGRPVYGDMLVIVPPGTTIWVPVPTRRVLAHLLPEYRKAVESAVSGSASARRTAEAVLAPEAMARRRAQEAEARAKGGAGAEQNARHLEVMNRRYEEDARKALLAATSDRNLGERTRTYEEARALLASGNAAVLDAPACAVIPKSSGRFDWVLVPDATPGCTRFVTPNPGLRNPKLPRSSLQIIHVAGITRSTRELRAAPPMREDPGDCVATTKLIRQVDWSSLAALLER